MKRGSRQKAKLPHVGVYTRIRPSKLNGIGVFAIRNIKKGTYVFPGDDDDILWVSSSQVKLLPRKIKRLYEDFSIVKEEGKMYGCPLSFNRLTVAWYLNESANPNVGCDHNYRFFALRDVKAGEELTVDYRAYNEFRVEKKPPKNP